MNPDQQTFYNFMMSSVQPGQEAVMKALLSQIFAQQDAGAFGTAQLQAVVPQMTTLLRPECVLAFTQTIATLSAQYASAAPAAQPVAASAAPMPVAAPAPVAPAVDPAMAAPVVQVIQPVAQPTAQPVVQQVVQPVVAPMDVCQSCGIPFETPAMQAVEVDGQLSPYCTGCYGGGSFLNPGATVAGMVALGVSRLARTMGEDRARAYMGGVVPGLGRWRR